MQILLNGLVSGVVIALLAVALQSVYLPTRVLFLGLAGVYTAAPYFVSAALNLGAPFPVAVSISVLSAMCLSVTLEWASHGRLSRRGAGEATQLIASLGLYIVIVQVVVLIWGNETRTLRLGLDTTARLGSVVATGSQGIALAVGSLSLSAMALFLLKSKLGLRFRALADNPTQLALYGYNIERLRYVGYALAGAFASASSLLTAYDIGFDPHTGLRALLLAIVAVIVGGRDGFLGPVLGSLILGVARAQVVWSFSAQWQDAATFGVLAAFLLLRPQGLIGRTGRLEAIR